jgi:hypothetical protein
MINYKDVKAQASFWRNSIAPYLEHKCEHSTTFAEYLSGFYNPALPKSFGIGLPNIFSLDFLKEFKDRQYTFYFNAAQDVQSGAAPLCIIYQISKNLHILANVHYWRYEDESDGQVTVYMVYENFQDVLDFIDKNQHLTKEPKEKDKRVGFQVGFAPPQ